MSTSHFLTAAPMNLLMVKMITMTKILQFVADKEIHVNKHMRMVLMAVTRLYSSPAVYNSLQSTTKKQQCDA